MTNSEELIQRWHKHKSIVAVQKKLEIWGKAQRESARRPKFDWGKFRRVKFPR